MTYCLPALYLHTCIGTSKNLKSSYNKMVVWFTSCDLKHYITSNKGAINSWEKYPCANIQYVVYSWDVGFGFAAGCVTPPLIHCCARFTRWASQRGRLHLISYKWRHKLAPVWLSNCAAFIFIDQTAKFVCVTDAAIKAALQKKRTRGEGNETDGSSPPVNQMTRVLRNGKKKRKFPHCWFRQRCESHL